jgi:hypothetical protein
MGNRMLARVLEIRVGMVRKALRGIVNIACTTIVCWNI